MFLPQYQHYDADNDSNNGVRGCGYHYSDHGDGKDDDYHYNDGQENNNDDYLIEIRIKGNDICNNNGNNDDNSKDSLGGYDY